MDKINNEDINTYIDKYFDVFNKNFPLLHFDDEQFAITCIKNCIAHKKKVEELYPQYTKTKGKLI